MDQSGSWVWRDGSFGDNCLVGSGRMKISTSLLLIKVKDPEEQLPSKKGSWFSFSME